MNFNKFIGTVVSEGNSSASIFDKILYFIEYFVLLTVCAMGYVFFILYLTDKLEGLGIMLLALWVMFPSTFQLISAPLVYKDVKKMQMNGVVIENTPFGWAIIVFFFPIVGLSLYLAIRRADYKKQLLSIMNQNTNTQ